MASVSISSRNRILLLLLRNKLRMMHHHCPQTCDFAGANLDGVRGAMLVLQDPFSQTSAVTTARHRAPTRIHKTRTNCSCSYLVPSPSLVFCPWGQGYFQVSLPPPTSFHLQVLLGLAASHRVTQATVTRELKVMATKRRAKTLASRDISGPHANPLQV